MQNFTKLFSKAKCNVIGMIHLEALPGTPCYNNGSWPAIVEKAKYEANIYANSQIDSVLIENMHDIPYVPQRDLGAETTACMARLAHEIRKLFTKRPIGIQVLAAANKQALAVAKACQLQYIRAEGFVFAHVADEGYTPACAGQLLRYRRQIDAEHVLIFSDLKKKHSSHAITQDISLLETAKAAEFFATDAIVLTGNATGDAVQQEDLLDLFGRIKVPLILGSGVTRSNLQQYFALSDAVIVGSHFKVDGHWQNELCASAVNSFMEQVQELRAASNKSKDYPLN